MTSYLNPSLPMSITRTIIASAILLTTQACALYPPPPPMTHEDMVARDLAEYREREAAGGGIKDILYEMIDASAPIAVQSGLCGYWDPGYWQIKVIEASVATDVPDLSDRFKAASLKEVERLQQDPSDRMPCGSGLQELALMYLTDLSMISDDY